MAEQLCRYITRPALCGERVQPARWVGGTNALDTRRDGTTYLVMTRIEVEHPHIEGRLCGIEFCECYVS